MARKNQYTENVERENENTVYSSKLEEGVAN